MRRAREGPEQGQAPPWVVPDIEDESARSAPGAVPTAVRDAARRAFDARPVDMGVAELVFDSLVDVDAEAAQAAGDGTVRTIDFRHADDRVRLAVQGGNDVLRVRLEVRPARPLTVEVRSPRPTFTVDVDAEGDAAFEVPPGLFSLVLQVPGRAVQTSWVRL